MNDNDPRTVTVLTDDERLAVFYGHTKNYLSSQSQQQEKHLR